ncbi:MAG: nucleotide exchange factor GrpE [Bacteroidetes bacterium]|nr:MAG: nucleotide exchange factor GrpE [Bacteroidota bacterium]
MTKKSDTSDKQKDKKEVKEEVIREERPEDLQEEAAETAEEAEDPKENVPKEAEKVGELTEKLADLQDKYLRLSAEYDNFRKRTLKEKIDLQQTANAKLLMALLPVADDFDRALQWVDEATDVKSLKEGMQLIAGKFSGFLNQQGVKEIEVTHKPFDTDVHEAVTKIPAPQKKLRGKVVEVVQKGYYLNDKVLRFAKVVIGE